MSDDEEQEIARQMHDQRQTMPVEVYIVLREEGDYSDYKWEIVYASLDKERAEDECRDRIQGAVDARARYAAHGDAEKRLMQEMYGLDVNWWSLPEAQREEFRKVRPLWKHERDALDCEYSVATVPLDSVGKFGGIYNAEKKT